ncbi:MAG: (4Fe-4S)-binding protein [Phaeodactylibacter sp.]|uniref:(4Fe-4S)-binding protein n=1 Tax=Phaeodactylibacter sp. TaxID=1940289 RepID=UPI0032EF7B2A
MSQEKSIVKEYSNGEVTIVWKPNRCMHSRLCFNGLPEVFDPKARPWVNATGAPSERMVEQVKKCPSGALAFYYNNEEQQADDVLPKTAEGAPEAEVIPNGPLMVTGTLKLKDQNGNHTVQEKRTAFCRCGASSNKPFCDGSHKKIGFEG